MKNSKGWKHAMTKACLIPQRYVLGLMGFLAVVNAYTMRVSLNIAITEMTPMVDDSNRRNPGECPGHFEPTNKTVSSSDSKTYDWSETTQGLILGSFYWGYVITHLPGGILAEKFGGKYALSLGILSTAIFTLLTPFIIIQTDGNWIVLVVLRMVEGLGEGTTYPALNTLLAKWIPLNERAKIGSLVYAGSQIGTIVSNLISGVLIETTQNWASVFYLFGSLGVLWFILFSLLCYSDPDSHPFISDEEKKFLQKEIENVNKEKTKTSIPWKAILTSWPVWALIAAQIGHDWGFYTMVTDLPKYMKDVLKFNIGQNGLWSSVPYMVMWLVSMFSGWLCDWLVQKRCLSLTVTRKMFTFIAAVGPGIFIMVASYSGCDRMLAVYMFTVSMGLMGSYYCGMRVNALDLSPNYAGTLMAITNGIGAFTGIISPYLAGALTENHSMEEWRTVFWISFAIFLVTAIIYVIFASAEVQKWNDPSESTKNRRKYTINDELTSRV